MAKKNKNKLNQEKILSSKSEDSKIEEAVANNNSEKEIVVEKASEKASKNEKSYTVLVSVLGGKYNQIFNHKEEVKASDLNGDVEELIAKGFIK